MGVVDEDAPEAVADEAVGDVEHVLEEGLPVDVDPAGEVGVVGAVAVVVRGHEDDVLGHLLGGPPRDLPGDHHVGPDREVVAVVLYRRRRDEDDSVLLRDLAYLGPGHLLI